MKETQQVEMKNMVVSSACRTYSYSVHRPEGAPRDFIVEVPLKLFTNGLKFQDGPLITRERLLAELAAELTGIPACLQLSINELDIVRYAERHSPKSSIWNRHRRIAS